MKKTLTSSEFVVWFMLCVNFLALFYLVWTPGSRISCNNQNSISIEVFCLGPKLNLIGNFLLLFPTAFLVSLLYKKTSLLVISVFIASLAFTIEITQFIVPLRDPSALDFLLNTIGALMCLLISDRTGFLQLIRNRIVS